MDYFPGDSVKDGWFGTVALPGATRMNDHFGVMSYTYTCVFA